MVNVEDLEVSYNAFHLRHTPEDPAIVLSQVEECMAGPWHAMIKSKLEPIAGQRVLEIACGRGALSYWLNHQGGEVWSADFSSEAVEMTQKLVSPHFPQATQRILRADFQQMPFDENSFDILISCETLEHLPEPEKALKEVFRVLKPGGRLYLTTENYLNITGLYRLYVEGIQRQPWRSGSYLQPVEQFFTAPQTISMLHAHGFEIQEYDSSGYYLYFPRQPKPIDLKVLSKPGLHRNVFRMLGRHFYVKALVRKQAKASKI